MHTPAPLSLRPLAELLRRIWDRSLEGDVVVREKDGARHRITVKPGRVVSVRVAGRFDPLLGALHQRGLLTRRGYRKSLEALGRSDRRSGQLAVEVGDLRFSQVQRELERQTRERFDDLAERARERGRDAWFESRRVAAREQCGTVSLALLLGKTALRRPRVSAPRTRRRPAESPPAQVATSSIQVSRRRLRELAKALHPDRNGHLDPETRAALAARLAEATARHHGLS